MKTGFQKKGWILAALLAVVLSVLYVHSAGAQTAASTSCAPYCDADLLPDSVVGHLQYPIPAKLSMLKDGHINFSQAVASNSGGTGGGGGGCSSWTCDEVRFAAAWTFCEHLMPDFPTPAYIQNGGNPTVDTITNQAADRDNTAVRALVASPCFEAIAYRTACPKNSANSFKYVNASVNCFQIQQEACHALLNGQGGSSSSTTPSPNGLGLTAKDGIGDPEADYALQHCDTDGLSLAMIDKINANRCNNAGYYQRESAEIGNAEEFRKTINGPECQQARDRFADKLAQEKHDLLEAARTALQLRGTGSAPNALARPTGGQ